MNKLTSIFFQIIKRKELLLLFIPFIGGTALFGWFTGKTILASYSLSYIPIAPSNAVIAIMLSIIIHVKIKLGNSHFIKSITNSILLVITLICLIIFFQYCFKLSWDLENVIIKNPKRFHDVLIGRMSPRTSLLFIFICIGVFGIGQRNTIIKYIGASLSLMVFVISSVLLIGYLYKAPLLYGSKIIPVSLPSVICLLLFSITLLRISGSQFWTYSLIKYNKVTHLLLNSFLPIVVFIVILQGFLITNFPIAHNNPTLSVAIILLIIVAITIPLLIKVSTIIGTQLQTAEQQLKESEEKFRSIMEHSADAIFIANPQGKYVYTNKAASAMLGYSSEEMKNKTIIDLSPPDKIEEYFLIFNQILTGEKAFAEIELIKKDGNYISTDLNAVLLPNGLVFGSCRDITERKQAEQALKESDTKYRMIADYNYDWEFWLTNDKKFKYNSPSCERISGYKPIDFFNNPNLITQIICPEDLAFYENHLLLSEDKACDGIDYRIITMSGEVRWINHVCQPIYNELGIKIGRRGSNCDITSRKNVEGIIINLNQELNDLNMDKDRFLSILGHDLKSPFNSLLGLSEMLINNIHKHDIDKIERLAININRSAINTYNLLEDILMWASSKQGNIPFNPQNSALEDICRNTFEILSPNAEAKNISLDYSGTHNISVFADVDMLKTVLRNLVSNAIKFTNKGGAVNINAVQTQSGITISVSDNGIGIPPDNISKLFDISQILTTIGTAKETGTGLGLLLCKEFVEKNGGKIWVESKQGIGSEFKFTCMSFEKK